MESLNDWATEQLASTEAFVALNAKELQEKLTGDWVDTERAASALNHIASLQGSMEAYADAQGDDPARAIERVTGRLLRGADDGWSGRGNDVRRSEFDGYRNAAKEILRYAERLVKAEVSA